MVHLTRSTTVRTDPAATLAYLADFDNAPEWDPGTISCTRLDNGPVRIGARWHNVSRVLGRETELEYRLTKRGGDGTDAGGPQPHRDLAG